MLHTEAVVSLPSLGQDVQLGMLFDARTLSFFSGASLWNDADINGMQEVTPNQVQHSEYKYTCSLDEARKNAGLNVEASLSLDLGLLKVEGSAKYLNKKKTSSFEARVDVSCTVARRTRRIPQEKLANIAYENRLGDQRFTHYVAEVVEGGSATLSFTQSCKSAQEKHHVQGHLKVIIESMPISGEANVDYKSNEESNYENIRVTYSGAIAERVTNMDDARRVAGEMPEKLAQQMNTLSYVLVPVSVLDSNCVRRQIRMLDGVLIKKTINALARGGAVQLDLDTLYRNAEFRDAFPTLQDQILGFKEAYESVSTQFSQDARRLLPELRDGTTDYTAKISELEQAVALFRKYTNVANQFATKKHAEADFLDRTIKELFKDDFEDYLTIKRGLVSFLDGPPRVVVTFAGADINLSKHPLQNLIKSSTTSTQEPIGDGSSSEVDDIAWFEDRRCILNASCTKVRMLRARLKELGKKAPIVEFGVASITKAYRNKNPERVWTQTGDVVLDYEGKLLIVTDDIPGRLEKDGSVLVPAISDVTCTSSSVEIPWPLRGEAAVRTTAAVIRLREKQNPGENENLEVVKLNEDDRIDKITRSDLKEDCDYEVQICFLTAMGPSEWSATTIVHTPKTPSPATTIVHSPITPTTVPESPRITPHPPRRNMLIKSVSSGQYLNGRNPGMQDPLVTSGRGFDLSTCRYFHWVIGDAGNGHQFIESISSGQYLDGRNPGMRDPLLSSGSRDPHSDRYLQWKIGDIGNGFKFIKSVSSGRYLDGRNPEMTDPCLSDGTRNPATDAYLQWKIGMAHVGEMP